jgi:hypothetical protein
MRSTILVNGLLASTPKIRSEHSESGAIITNPSYLSWACKNAFNLKLSSTGSAKHIFWVAAQLTAKAESGEMQKVPRAKMFEVEDGQLVAKADLSEVIYDGVVRADEMEMSHRESTKEGVMFILVQCRDYCNLMRLPWNKSGLLHFVEDKQ